MDLLAVEPGAPMPVEALRQPPGDGLHAGESIGETSTISRDEIRLGSHK